MNFKNILKGIFLMCIPFLFVWICWIATGFRINLDEWFNSGAFWFITCMYWFATGFTAAAVLSEEGH